LSIFVIFPEINLANTKDQGKKTQILDSKIIKEKVDRPLYG